MSWTILKGNFATYRRPWLVNLPSHIEAEVRMLKERVAAIDRIKRDHLMRINVLLAAYGSRPRRRKKPKQPGLFDKL